ncbi:uncharacterized protein [Neodiprion pinetum]|uniref:uncharacterized protein n=1 Tax=Neodiprion pinetum TaxID=441929 RepID=UPI001EDF9C11|nr:uncharacterized protein LOC124222414 isoform X1 [Neodiprion pinetum]XP_046489295.1 uncharacterized protein LOC124222414 isoform X1 [Neodiprion pinetum]
MEPSQKSSDNLLVLEDGLAWQKKSKDQQFVSVSSYESRVSKCLTFSFILLTIALVGIVAYELQQAIRTEYLITDAEIRAMEISEENIENVSVSRKDSDFLIPSSEPTTTSFSDETNQDAKNSQSSEERKEEQIFEETGVKTSGDWVDETSDSLKLLEEALRNLNLYQEESFERLLEKIESIDRKTEIENPNSLPIWDKIASPIDPSVVGQIPEEDRSTAVSADAGIENPTEKPDKFRLPTTDDWMKLFLDMSNQKHEEIDDDDGIDTVLEEDSFDDYAYEDSYEDYNDYYSMEEFESAKGTIEEPRVTPETMEAKKEVTEPLNQESDSICVACFDTWDERDNLEDFVLSDTKPPVTVATGPVGLDQEDSTDENPNEPTGSENTVQTTDGGGDPPKGNNLQNLWEIRNDDAKNYFSDNRFRSDLMQSFLETASSNKDEEIIKALREMFGPEQNAWDDYGSYDRFSDYPMVKRSISTSPVNGRLDESHSSPEKSARLMGEMRKAIDEETSALHDLVSVASGPVKPVLEAELDDFYKRMEAVSAHIDRLHERYLRLNEVTDDYVSKEFPASEEANDYGYRY